MKNLLAEINLGKPRFPGVVPLLFLLNASRITRLLGETVRELVLDDQRHELANQNTALALESALRLARFARWESKLASIRLDAIESEVGGKGSSKAARPLRGDTLKHWVYVLEKEGPNEDAFEYFRKVSQLSVTFLDIGANTGISALSIYKVAPQWPIVSIEMLGILEPMLRLTYDYFKEVNHAFCYKICGLGSERSEIRMSVPIVEGEYVHTMSSMCDGQFQKDYIIRHLDQLSTGGVWNHAVEKFPATIERFDDLPLDVGGGLVFAKIDAEGQELSVLQGMTYFLEGRQPGLLLELDDIEPVRSFLRDRGYRDQYYHFDTRLNRLVPGWAEVAHGNYFFFPENSPLFVDS